MADSTFLTSWTPITEAYWPDVEVLDYRNTFTDFELPEGTFFDFGVVHVLTTATLDRLRELYPEERVEARRPRASNVPATRTLRSLIPSCVFIAIQSTRRRPTRLPYCFTTPLRLAGLNGRGSPTG